jgi:hypothetical protein
MTVVPFRRTRPPHRLPGPIEPPPALAGRSVAPATSPPDAAEDRRRMLENLGALAAVVVLVVVGAWLIVRLEAYSRTMACIEFGHRSCMKIDVGQAR